ncbi:MFS transporter permease [Microbacterium terrisoli]|uniref:MFS transporter permease n=1 Tax=Microbacterium terrisoli TaxID=3242192 RepID=UPI002803F64B|nr:MFS transporter permease [Microbacterium protaetiae]
MWMRRGLFAWLLPAAIVLPVWLVVGWAIFNAGGWAFLGVIFFAAPAVLVGEVIIALLIRARPTVRSFRAVSWWDALWITVWHLLVIAYGLFLQAAFAPILVGAIIAFLALFWSSLAQLWNEARGSFSRLSPGSGPADVPHEETLRQRGSAHADVIVVNEVGRPGDGRSAH